MNHQVRGGVMRVRMISLDGREDLILERLLTVVGRHPRCDVRLTSSRVSRRHCCLALDQAGVLARDLESTNGITINGERVVEGPLRHGDELGIAHLRYRVEMAPEPEMGISRTAEKRTGGRPPGSELETILAPELDAGEGAD